MPWRCATAVPVPVPPLVVAAVAGVLVGLSGPAHAAGLDGTSLRWPWALPFAGLLISIATGPLLFPKLWHAHYGKIAFAWSALTIVPVAALYDLPTALATLAHAIVGEYMSFIVLLFALYVVAGGILVTGTLRGTPLVNTAILAFGTAIASIVGTTGAAMILVRPLLRANAGRLHNVHVVVFFIILVANIGGALSPLGDPPLFVGFLHGVDFSGPRPICGRRPRPLRASCSRPSSSSRSGSIAATAASPWSARPNRRPRSGSAASSTCR